MQLIYPWQSTQWHRLQKARETGRLPHAMLFSGIAGLGKNAFALLFVKSLYCETLGQEKTPCGLCPSCRQIEVGVFPDVMQIAPESLGKQISVGEIRTVSNFLSVSAVKNQFRCVLIHEADQMTVAAMNALLKTLEEPTGNALFFLITSVSHRLTATIKSRCQKVLFYTPDLEEGVRWVISNFKSTREEAMVALKYNMQAPLKAGQWLEEEGMTRHVEWLNDLMLLLEKKKFPSELSAKYEKQNVTSHLMLIFLDIAKLKALNKENTSKLWDEVGLGEAYWSLIRRLSDKIMLEALMACMDKMIWSSRRSGIALNPRLVLEDILITLMDKEKSYA